MTLKPYPAYRAADVKWLDRVPSGWEVLRLKDVSSVTPSNVDKKSYDGQVAVQLCNYTDVYYNEEITAGLDFMMATASVEEIQKYGLRAGQVIITKDSETAVDIGIAAYVPVDLPGVVCGYHLSVLETNGNAEARFLKRLFDSSYVKSMLATRANGLTRVGLGQAALSTLPLPIPPIAEQCQISDYLDIHTAKIDLLIGKQERLIETLAERRQAVISHAVTKGLDPNVPMKDSGVEWLGEIPAHWDMRKLRALSTVISKGTTPSTIGETYQDEGIRFIRGEDLQAGVVGAERPTFISEETHRTLKRSQLRVGDVLFVIAGTLGKCAIVTSIDLPANTNQAIAFIRPKPGEASRFLWYWLSSAAVEAMTSLNSVTSAQPNLSMENLGNFPVPVILTSERASIIRYLDRETAQTDALSAKAREMIDVLKERRQALISAAVTGKIDVRGLS